MSNDESREIVPAAPHGGALVVGGNAGTLALATMSEQEFQARLLALKKGNERLAVIKRELMEVDVDYGIIPGTPKPTLYKPGAEKLGDFYQLRADFISERTIGDGVTTPTISYQTKCLLHLASLDGPVVATGHGSANSWEKKHRYRSGERACPECGALKTIIKGKDEYEKDARFKGGWLCFIKKGGCGAKFTASDARIVNQQLGEVENPDPWDLDNTLLKMSEKRAYVDGILRGTASSGLFTQDLEDMPEPERSRAADAADARAEQESREHARDKAERKGNSNGSTMGLPNYTMPDDPAEIVAWFDAAVEATADPGLKGSGLKTAAQDLARFVSHHQKQHAQALPKGFPLAVDSLADLARRANQ